VKEIAQIGAAIGREFSYELIAAAAPLQQSQLDDALGQLTDSGLAFRRGTPPEATYTFKHALVQDAAYDSLLKSKRQALHGKIARVVEERFPNIKDTEPEVLAHHFAAAGLHEAAIPLWQTAGEFALKSMALTESVSHLNHGLELADALPQSLGRDTMELDMRVLLGTAWIALKGWAAPEVWSSLHPALTLAKSISRDDALVPVLQGLWVNVLTQGRATESLRWAEEMLDVAKATGNADLLITGHLAFCNSYFYAGQLHEALKHADQALELYDDERHRHFVNLLNHDFKTSSSVYKSLAMWTLGYPDRAVRLSDEALVHARRIGHPFDLGWALSYGTDLFHLRGEPERQRKSLDECDRLGRENSLPVMWALMTPIRYGMAFIREGKAAEGIAPLKAGLAFWDEIGGKIYSPYHTSVLAEGMAMLGDIDEALKLVDEKIEQAERPGWEERHYYAEMLRLKGWMLSLKNDLDGAEKNYGASLDWAREQKAKSWELRTEKNYGASLDWAREQKAKSWELRTSTSLARLWRQQGKRKEAHDLLAPVYNWFTEGFDTKDLKEAKALLDELSA
jgi:predicted ATPase